LLPEMAIYFCFILLPVHTKITLMNDKIMTNLTL
jgi:hypothetical protein